MNAKITTKPTPDPFLEARRAHTKLLALDKRREAIRAELSADALAMLEGLEEHRASQPIAEVPSSPEAGR
jgi:hypothetical protein